MSSPRILIYDIENSHSVAATFPVYKANISHQCIIQDWFMFCASWKWHGEKRVYSTSLLDDPKRFKKDYTDDYHVVKELHAVISQADAIVAHNGDAFDIKKFAARAIYHGLPPLPAVVQIDTLKMARSKFKFTFNKLDYLGEFLGVGKKLKTDINLWMDCLFGDEAALKKMVRYNKVDVKVLEKVYDILAPWCPSKLNHNHFTSDKVCAKCGSGDWTSYSKERLTLTGKMKQLQWRRR